MAQLYLAPRRVSNKLDMTRLKFAHGACPWGRETPLTRLAGMPSIRRPRLLTAAVVAVLAVLPLSGCVYAQIPAPTPGDDASSSTPAPATPSEDPGTASGELPSTLGFDDGTALPSTAYIEWGDGLMTDDGWEIASPDDGQGNWSYSTVDGSCTAHFWQGRLGPDIVVPDDDAATSDAVIATFLGGSPADVTPNATTGAFSYQTAGNADVETRQVAGEGEGRTWIMAARGFSSLQVGLYVIADCSSGDPADTLAAINDLNAVVVTP